MILAGDIGGTKTNLALFEHKNKRLNVIAQHQFSSREFSDLNEVIMLFRQKTSLPSIDAACFGIAGPVIEGRCRTTNLPWDITTSDLKDHLGIQKVRLLNDLEATAYGMLYVPEDEFVDLNPKGRQMDGNRAVIAAGTGLGEAMLYYDGSVYYPIGSEGGHSDFAPLTPQQDALLKWMRNRYPGHVSFERILSGPGIYTLYEFLVENDFSAQPASMLNIPEGKDRSAMVSECALKEHNPLCMEALRLFAEIYGAEAGNLALKSMSLGGVYIGGGIAPKILQILANNHFMNGFLSKGRFNEMLQAMQVKVSLNPETALLGAAYYAHDRL
ncbi:glucokinase [Sulfurovum sp. XTW-4]|uniref:Glucokinase n=1 Tax=Sulfurovum xiamenensis TaxID=3019066 RepID=A0ABT7QQT1_9BACT|nr:glucokinase [Sulfurovum xiamenensis]MDM5263219.1 glucokinase [Sulfurovum xiamenensis]